MNRETIKHFESRESFWFSCLSVALFVGLGVYLFFPYIFANQVLFTNDAVIVTHHFDSMPLLQTLVGSWRDNVLVGLPHFVSVNVPLLLRRIIGIELWNDTLWVLVSLAGSLALLWYLRLKGLDWLPATISALVCCWLGTNFTLVYSGHSMKPFVLLFAICAMCFAHRLARRPNIADAIFLGGTAGAMFMHQADVAFLFSLLLAPYVVLEMVIMRRRNFRVAAFLGVSVLICGLLSSGALWNGYQQFGKDIAIQEDPTEKWSFMTQWSWPPGESLAFIAPGYMGWRSDDPSGPYWGEMGRSASWETDGSGFANFKLDNTYLGIVPFVLAVIAFANWRDSSRGPHILFWGAVAIVSLLLAFGKYFLLYGWIYEFPVIHHIRNPNKFLHIFQLAIAILAAYGAQELFKCYASKQRRPLPLLSAGLLISVGVIALSYRTGLSANSAGAITELTGAGMPFNLAQTIIDIKLASLMHLFLVALIAASIIYFAHTSKIAWFPPIAGLLLVALIVVDVVLLARHYLQPMPRSYIAANELTETLKSEQVEQRFMMIDRQGVNNIWASFLFPFHGIASMNVVLISRMPSDYARFLEAFDTNYLRLWQLSATGYVLGTRAQAAELVPRFAASLMEYDVSVDFAGDLRIISVAGGRYVLMKLRRPAPRFALIADATRVSSEETLSLLKDTSSPPLSTVYLNSDAAAPELSGSGVVGNVTITNYQPGAVQLTVNTQQAAYLRFAERFDPRWRASIDGTETPIHRADYLFQAIFVPPGDHTIRIRYSPSTLYLFLQLIGLSTVLAATLYKLHLMLVVKRAVD